jgi:hypothetical protein
MSAVEYEDIVQTGRFRSVGNALMGKWFAESRDDAITWSQRLTYAGRVFVVEIELAETIVPQLYRVEYLDGIGPARYVNLEELEEATILAATDVTKL